MADRVLKIKALSLWQPWASLIAVGAKKYETRSWRTPYHGPLLICASKKPFRLGEYPEEFENAARNALNCMLVQRDSFVDLPYGKAVAIVYHSVCVPTTQMRWPWNWTDEMKQKEMQFGDFSPGRYAWKLENVRAIEPFLVKGRQGLFEMEVLEKQIL